MKDPSAYPPGVTGNEYQIAGEDDRETLIEWLLTEGSPWLAAREQAAEDRGRAQGQAGRDAQQVAYETELVEAQADRDLWIEHARVYREELAEAQARIAAVEAVIAEWDGRGVLDAHWIYAARRLRAALGTAAGESDE